MFDIFHVYNGLTKLTPRLTHTLLPPPPHSNRNNPPDYAGYTYDAVWAYALALDKLLKEDRTHVSNFHTVRTVE